MAEPDRIYKLHREKTKRPEEPTPHFSFATPEAVPFVNWTWKALGESIRGLYDFVQERGSPYGLDKPVDMAKYVGKTAALDEVDSMRNRTEEVKDMGEEGEEDMEVAEKHCSVEEKEAMEKDRKDDVDEETGEARRRSGNSVKETEGNDEEGGEEEEDETDSPMEVNDILATDGDNEETPCEDESGRESREGVEGMEGEDEEERDEGSGPEYGTMMEDCHEMGETDMEELYDEEIQLNADIAGLMSDLLKGVLVVLGEEEEEEEEVVDLEDEEVEPRLDEDVMEVERDEVAEGEPHLNAESGMDGQETAEGGDEKPRSEDVSESSTSSSSSSSSSSSEDESSEEQEKPVTFAGAKRGASGGRGGAGGRRGGMGGRALLFAELRPKVSRPSARDKGKGKGKTSKTEVGDSGKTDERKNSTDVVRTDGGDGTASTTDAACPSTAEEDEKPSETPFSSLHIAETLEEAAASGTATPTTESAPTKPVSRREQLKKLRSELAAAIGDESDLTRRSTRVQRVNSASGPAGGGGASTSGAKSVIAAASLEVGGKVHYQTLLRSLLPNELQLKEDEMDEGYEEGLEDVVSRAPSPINTPTEDVDDRREEMEELVRSWQIYPPEMEEEEVRSYLNKYENGKSNVVALMTDYVFHLSKRFGSRYAGEGTYKSYLDVFLAFRQNYYYPDPFCIEKRATPEDTFQLGVVTLVACEVQVDQWLSAQRQHRLLKSPAKSASNVSNISASGSLLESKLYPTGNLLFPTVDPERAVAYPVASDNKRLLEKVNLDVQKWFQQDLGWCRLVFASQTGPKDATMKWGTFLARAHWSRAQLFSLWGKVDEALELYSTVKYNLENEYGERDEEDANAGELPPPPSDYLVVPLPNLTALSSLNVPLVEASLTYLEEKRSLEQVVHFADTKDYGRVLKLLKITFRDPGRLHTILDRDSSCESESSRSKTKRNLPNRHTQLRLLAEALSNLGDPAKSVKWGALALHETWLYVKRHWETSRNNEWTKLLMTWLNAFRSVLFPTMGPGEGALFSIFNGGVRSSVDSSVTGSCRAVNAVTSVTMDSANFARTSPISSPTKNENSNSNVLDHLSPFQLKRLAEDSINVIHLSMDVSEYAVNPALPTLAAWFLLYKVLKHVEDKGEEEEERRKIVGQVMEGIFAKIPVEGGKCDEIGDGDADDNEVI